MSYNKTKTDPSLGLKIHNHLVSCGVETPSKEMGFSRTEKIDILEDNFKSIMTTLGLDLTDDILIYTLIVTL